MARLTRITGKIFGETATTTGDDPQIGQFGSALAGAYVGTADVATIQSLPAWSNGFIDAVTASNQYPPLPEMTGFGKVLSYQQNYLMQQGIPEWDSGTTYYINNFCSYNGIIYISKTDNNYNNNPSSSVVNWDSLVTLSNSWAMPDWANKVSKNFNTEYTAEKDGWLYAYSFTQLNASFVINGTSYIFQSGNNANLYSGSICYIPIAKNDVYSVVGENGSTPSIGYIYFISMKGA